MFLLCRTGRGLAAFEPVAGAFETDDVGVVNDPVDHCGGDGRVAEDFTPEPEGQVARHDQRCVFVAARDELEEQVRGVLIEWNVTDLVADQDAVAAEPAQFRGEFAAGVGVLEAGDPARCCIKQDPVAVLGCLNRSHSRETVTRVNADPKEGQ